MRGVRTGTVGVDRATGDSAIHEIGETVSFALLLKSGSEGSMLVEPAGVTGREMVWRIPGRFYRPDYRNLFWFYREWERRRWALPLLVLSVDPTDFGAEVGGEVVAGTGVWTVGCRALEGLLALFICLSHWSEPARLVHRSRVLVVAPSRRRSFRGVVVVPRSCRRGLRSSSSENPSLSGAD